MDILKKVIASTRRQTPKTDHLQEEREPRVSELLFSLVKADKVEKSIDTWTIADGGVALVRGTDGNAYEVVVRPARLGKFKDLFARHLQKKGEAE